MVAYGVHHRHAPEVLLHHAREDDRRVRHCCLGAAALVHVAEPIASGDEEVRGRLLADHHAERAPPLGRSRVAVDVAEWAGMTLIARATCDRAHG